jgi:hypothetical protein
MPESGAVTATPGNQTGSTLNAALVARQHGRTIYYGLDQESQHTVTKLVAGNPEHAG